MPRLPPTDSIIKLNKYVQDLFETSLGLIEREQAPFRSLYLRYGLGDLHDHGDRDRMADTYRQLLTGRLSGPDDVRQ